MGSKSVRIPEDTYRALKIMAATQGVGLGQLVTRLLQSEQDRDKMSQIGRDVVAWLENDFVLDDE